MSHIFLGCCSVIGYDTRGETSDKIIILKRFRAYEFSYSLCLSSRNCKFGRSKFVGCFHMDKYMNLHSIIGCARNKSYVVEFNNLAEFVDIFFEFYISSNIN